MAITSIMRDKIGIDKSLGTLTLSDTENANSIIKKGIRFINRNVNKRKTPVSNKEVQDILGYLFQVNARDVELHLGAEDVVSEDIYSFLARFSDSQEEERKRYGELRKQFTYLANDMAKNHELSKDEIKKRTIWSQFTSTYREGKEMFVTVLITPPNALESSRNGAVFSYRGIEGLTFQISLDRLISFWVLVDTLREVGVIGDSETGDKFILEFIHNGLPQVASLQKKHWGYRPVFDEFRGKNDYGNEVSVFTGLAPKAMREEYFKERKKADELVVKGFKRAYRTELNIKAMDDYAKGLGKSVATAFETKKNIPPKIQEAMAKSKFLGKGFKFVELDEDTDLEKYAIVEEYFLQVEDALPKVPIQSLRFRKLGKHRVGGLSVSGLFSPYFQSIAIDLRMFGSFIHEYAHAIDYLLTKGEIQSMSYEFTDILNMYEEGLSRKIYNISYYLTPTEVFARGYEVAFRAKYEELDTGLVPEVEAMRGDTAYKPFYQNEELYKAVIEFMGKYIN